MQDLDTTYFTLCKNRMYINSNGKFKKINK